ncbi:hypothetical protein [Pseudonocardia sp. H11422]|uniref:hypothetical protein n=1 Tax=Pseudonocardia sp. H11422 TaxID=2835866 RepID=UPI001BDBEF69|nr:hypothetical protein [Pseudonocardia sp. H11422]
MYQPKPFARQYFLLLLVGAAVALGLYLGLSYAQGVRPVSSTFDAQQSTARIELLKLALASTAGIAAIAGLYVAYRKQRNDEAGAVREQDRVFTERFSAAAELLESEKAAVRLAGLNALARLADDSLRDRATCLETICAYLRLPFEIPEYSTERFSISNGNPLPGTWELGDRQHWKDAEEWEVRRSALTLITERLKPANTSIFWEGARVDLRGAVLIELDLSGCRIESDFDAGNSFVVTNRGGVVWRDLVAEKTMVFIGATFACGLIIEESHIQERIYFHTTRFLSPVTFARTRFTEHLSLSAADISQLEFEDVELVSCA